MENEVRESEDENAPIIVTAVKGKISADGLVVKEEESSINWMSISQTQKYFAVGTENGFMIIQNDSTMSMK